MKVFISWSGDLSKEIAKLLTEYIPDVIQEIEPFLSSNDIEKGERWSDRIAKELDETSFGILCITRENFRSDWIAFEAGALSKGIGNKTRVCPLLYNLEPTEITHSPLSTFQMTKLEEEELFKLFQTMNKVLENNKLNEQRLERAFKKTWADINQGLNEIKICPENKDTEKVATLEDKVNEILNIVRLSLGRESEYIRTQEVINMMQASEEFYSKNDSDKLFQQWLKENRGKKSREKSK